MIVNSPWWIVFSALAIVPPLCAWLLRAARGTNLRDASAIQWPIVSGLIAGFLLGPTFAGRLWPQPYEQWVIGGTTQRQALTALVSRQGADDLAAQHARYSSAQLQELHQKQDEERKALEQELSHARWLHQRPLRLFIMSIVTLTFIASSHGAFGRREERQGWSAPLSIGAWSAVLPGAVTYTAMVLTLNIPNLQALMAAASLGIGPWLWTANDRKVADDVEHGGARMMQTAGRVATVCAMVAVMWALWSSHQGEGLLLALPFCGLPLAWMLSFFRQRRCERKTRLHELVEKSWLIVIAEAALVPVMIATATFKIDWILHFAFWPILIILIVSDDGRWIGAYIGSMLTGGRSGITSLRLALGSMNASVTQAAMAAGGVYSELLSPEVALAIFLGAALIEVTVPVRRSLAEFLARQQMTTSSDKTDDECPP